ncbi:MAG TPA: FIST N-terminal domain-containing protein [Humisphaera sp.]|nr:FIST N-terminal domain-containing protein [Humisphaera sp.]
MRFHSSIADDESTDDAASRVIESSREALAGQIDLGFVFFTDHHRKEAERLIERLWLELDPQCLVGCSAEGVIGGEREIERSPGLALLVASVPNVRLHPFHVAGQDAWQEVLADPPAMRERLGAGAETRALICFGDPFSAPMSHLFRAVDDELPGLPIVGGMASAARRPGQNAIVRNDEIYDQGMVGVSLSGPIDVQTVVSQGCKPIGRTLIVTKSHENVIEQLGGKPALAALRDSIAQMPEQDQHLLQNGLMVGQAISEYRERFGRGDFLVRNVIDIHEDKGAIAVADYVRTGQTIQFHVRDAQTADEDLSMMLEPQRLGAPAAGGLLFSCNGRGQRMFDAPGHDIGASRRILPQTPIAGFFAAGEFGPVGEKNFMHGHTASFAMFRQT